MAIGRVGREVEKEVLRVHPGSFGRTTTGVVTTFVGVRVHKTPAKTVGQGGLLVFWPCSKVVSGAE